LVGINNGIIMKKQIEKPQGGALETPRINIIKKAHLN